MIIFRILVRKHKCKRCLRAVCANCSKTKILIIDKSDSYENHRVCNICKEESDY